MSCSDGSQESVILLKKLHVKQSKMNHLWEWGQKGGIAILERSIFSGSNFIFNVLLVRWLNVEDYGQFAIVYTGFVFLLHIYAALLIEPMSVLGIAYYAGNLSGYFRAQVKIHFILTIFLGAVTFLFAVLFGYLGGGSVLFWPGMLVLAFSFMLFPWLMRRIFYVFLRPEVSLIGSLIYAMVLLALLIGYHVQHTLTPGRVILVMALAGLISGLVMVNYLKEHEPISPIWSQVLRENWIFGKWLVGSAIFIGAASQAQVFIAANQLGVAEAGMIRALQTIIQPMILPIATLSALATPVLSKDFASGQWHKFRYKTFFLIALLFICAILFETVLLFYYSDLDILLYNAKLSEYAVLIPVWGTIPVILALISGLQAGLQAAQKTKAIFIGAVSWAGVSVGGGYYLTKWAGFLGTSLSAVLGYCVMGIVLLIIYARWTLVPLFKVD